MIIKSKSLLVDLIRDDEAPLRYTKYIHPGKIDNWFDVFDSRTQFHRSKQLKNGLGVHEEQQVAALNKMLNLMENITFGGKLKPFMKGIVSSTKSLLALWDDLKRREWSHICTYNLNQDILELFFSNIRSLCGANDHPRANNFGSRFRILMLSSNCMKVLVDNANVAPAENGDEQEWTMFNLVNGASEDFEEEAKTMVWLTWAMRESWKETLPIKLTRVPSSTSLDTLLVRLFQIIMKSKKVVLFYF